MKGKIAGILSSLFLALAILTVSIFKGASSNYAFSNTSPTPNPETEETEVDIDYQMAYPGKIIPDHPLWYIKVIRDRLGYLFTFSSDKKAELNLLYADKRIQMAKTLFDKKKYDLGYSTLTKSEKYLEKALEPESDNLEFLKKYAQAALKHRQIIEYDIMPYAPEDLRPQINTTQDITRNSYNKASQALREKGETLPENPFGTE